MNWLLHGLLFLPEQASSFARRVDNLHVFVITTTMVVATGVGLAALYFLVRYRRQPGDRTTPRITSPVWLEVLIIVVPLSFFLLWFGIGFRDYVWMRTPPNDAVDVYVTGKKWMWKFAYPEGPSGVNTLRVPVGRPVRVLITSRDVIHSFFVPAFRIKQDALPGRYTEVWFEATRAGRFEVLCAEYCGTEHSMMRAEVIAMPEPDFQRWLDEQRGPTLAREDMGDEQPPGIVERGRVAAVQHGCLTCHSTDGTQHIGPTWQDLFGRQTKLENGQTVPADPGYLTESMMDPKAKIVAGYPPVMPTFQGQLGAPDAAAIVEYIKSLRTDRLQPTPDKGPIYEQRRTP